jgi:hypothetical protein
MQALFHIRDKNNNDTYNDTYYFLMHLEAARIL